VNKSVESILRGRIKQVYASADVHSDHLVDVGLVGISSVRRQVKYPFRPNLTNDAASRLFVADVNDVQR
jgi:hypothetical protein